MVTVTLGWWMIPAALTLATWAWVQLQPAEPRGGMYNFPARGMVRAICAIVLTLLYWLAYFIIF